MRRQPRGRSNGWATAWVRALRWFKTAVKRKQPRLPQHWGGKWVGRGWEARRDERQRRGKEGMGTTRSGSTGLRETEARCRSTV